MALKQLLLVAKIEQEREEKAAQTFQQATAYVNDNQMKLDGLLQYRLDYFNSVHQRAQNGLEAMSFGHHQNFIKKLDTACSQQQQLTTNSKSAAEQRKMQWLQQQRKRKAVQMLIDKKQAQQRTIEEKQEQAMLDEFALQKLYRS